jgi:DUF4097 and DUF4098 domain-containing protein YvlB
MKKIILLMVLMVLLVITGFSGETLQKTFKVTKGKQLDLNLKEGGAVSIIGWEKEQVAVTVRFKDTSPDQWDIRFDETPQGIEIESVYKSKWKRHRSTPSFEIQVPNRFDLEIKTMGGDIGIAHVQGEILGKTMGGDLEFHHLKGHIEFKTMGGAVTLKDSDIDGKIKTMGGRVLLENVIGDIKGTSMGGNVIYRNVKTRSGESTGKTVKISTMGGGINVSEAAEGADVHTMGGNIHIKSARKFVKAKTMGGDIRIDAVDGKVKATTMGGDVNVTMTGDPGKGDRAVKLTSMGGDITLTVPPGLSMDVDIQLVYTKKAKKKYNIISDFQLEVEEPGDWEAGKGSPRKTIYGKAAIAGGKHKIKLKTIDGNIYLKKSR